MKKLSMKIKGKLGFCQCKKCWNRSIASMKVKQLGTEIDVIEICEKHAVEFINCTKLSSVTIKMEDVE